jgi:hypothetical protein
MLRARAAAIVRAARRARPPGGRVSFDDEDAAPEVSQPTVNGAMLRVIVAAVVVGLVAAVVQWERGHIASPVPELPPPSAADARICAMWHHRAP